MRKSLIFVFLIPLTSVQVVYASTDDARRAQTADTSLRETSPRPISSEVRGQHEIADSSYGQTGTGPSQTASQPPRHKHHLRSALIVFGACFGMALVFAVASK